MNDVHEISTNACCGSALREMNAKMINVNLATTYRGIIQTNATEGILYLSFPAFCIALSKTPRRTISAGMVVVITADMRHRRSSREAGKEESVQASRCTVPKMTPMMGPMKTVSVILSRHLRYA
jgi:hypothetical protein